MKTGLSFWGRFLVISLLLQGALAPVHAHELDCPAYLIEAGFEHNPLVTSPHGIHWDRIRPEHFVPALRHQFEVFKNRFALILGFPYEPDFISTVLSVELSAHEFTRTLDVYAIYSLNHNSLPFQAIEREVDALQDDFYELIYQNRKYYNRVSAVLKKLKPGTEEYEMTRQVYEDFRERGIHLPQAERKELSRIERRLTRLRSQFNQNRMLQDNSVEIKVTDLQVLEGLPEKWLEMVKQSRDHTGAYRIPLKNHSLVTQIMENVHSSEFRRKVFFAGASREVSQRYITAEEAGASWDVDNRPVLLEIITLRQKRARLLGLNNHAELVLKDRMAGSTLQVHQFYEDLLPGIQALANREKAELEQFARTLNPSVGRLEPWDRAFYVKRLYQQKYHLDEDKVSEYFEVNRTLRSVFDFYEDLFGIRIEKLEGASSWLPEVEVYRISDRTTGEVLSELHVDLYTRDTKSPGAWKASIQKAGSSPWGRQGGVMEITLNVDRAPEGRPTLLRIGEVNTLFHELGHAMHEAFSKTHYTMLAGTAVKRDFVEFPSQIMENWLYTPEFLNRGAIHYQTGERIPEEWIERIRDADRFRIGTGLRRQIMLGLIDLHWHSTSEDFSSAPAHLVDEFEKGIYDRYGVDRLEEFSPFSPSFGHIFSGGYAMGYYSYLWGNMIEADGFDYWYSDPSRIHEKARALRETILSRGGTRDPNELYRAWTGRGYSTAPFLKRIGL
jgi:Zn-dependent oligopeptidase